MLWWDAEWSLWLRDMFQHHTALADVDDQPEGFPIIRTLVRDGVGWFRRSEA